MKIKLTSECMFCGKGVQYNPYHQTGKYCNSQCAGQHKQQTRFNQWLSGDIVITERSTLRQYLTLERGYSCSVCSVSEWQGKPITLQVDHINGNPGDNSLHNLRLICPNCHSQTDHYGGRNKGSGRKARGLPLH